MDHIALADERHFSSSIFNGIDLSKRVEKEKKHEKSECKHGINIFPVVVVAKVHCPWCNATNNIASTYQDNNTLSPLSSVHNFDRCFCFWTIVMFAMILWRQDVTIFFFCIFTHNSNNNQKIPFQSLCTKDEWKLIRNFVDNFRFGIESHSFTNKLLINIVKSTIFT